MRVRRAPSSQSSQMWMSQCQNTLESTKTAENSLWNVAFHPTTFELLRSQLQESSHLSWQQRTPKLFLPLCQPCARLEL